MGFSPGVGMNGARSSRFSAARSRGPNPPPRQRRSAHGNLRSARSVRRAVFAREDPFPLATEHGHDVVRRIEDLVAGGAVANLEIDHIAIATVHPLVRRARGRKSGAHPRAENRYAGISDERWFALQYVDELVLLAVTMQKRGLSPRRESGEIHAEILQTEQIAERSFPAFGHPREERLGVVRRSGAKGRGARVDRGLCGCFLG